MTESEARLAAQAIRDDDTAAISGLIRRNRLHILQGGVRVRWVYEKPPGLAEVRIISGEHAGITCVTLDGALTRE